jgi:flavin reductase (DIM6/NTAB) family NADH-FMN oxidoreductase RutF
MQKKSFGPKLFLYPMPTVIVGALVKGKPNFNTIAYCGVAQSKPPMLAISMDKRRYTHSGVVENKSFSINIPSEEMLKKTDYIGTVSGKQVDKSKLFSIFYGTITTAPMIQECPITMECSLVDVMDFKGKNDLLIGKVIDTFVDDGCLGNTGPDILKVSPIAYSWHDHTYWSLGRCLGKVSMISKGEY